MVFAISSTDDLETLQRFRDQMGITFPILHDADGSVSAQYTQLKAEGVASAYPEDWVIGSDGRVAYVNNGYDPDQMIAIIEAELGP